MIINVEQPVPDFTPRLASGSEWQFADLAGHAAGYLTFYPKDTPPAAPRKGPGIRDLHAILSRANTLIFFRCYFQGQSAHP